jgi:NTE family protein
VTGRASSFTTGYRQKSATLPRHFGSSVFSLGEPLIREGEGSEEILVIERRSAELSRFGPDGRILRLSHVEEGAACGEASFLARNPASATVTALSDVSALAIRAAAFAPSAREHPSVYPNLGTPFADRRLNAERRSAPPARAMWLLDYGAPPLAAYALSCSVAWHTRQPTLLIVSDGKHLRDTGLAQYVGVDATAAARLGARAVIVERPLTFEQLDEDVRAACASGTNVVLLAPEGSQLSSIWPAVGMLSPDAVVGSTLIGRRLIRAWSDRQPAQRYETSAPKPSGTDMSQLRAGRLALDTPLGRSLGEVARACCGLRVGLALGDGSAKGFAHFGVLGALEEAGVPCDAIAGTSIGAAVAGLYAAGFPIDTAQAHLARVGSSTFRPKLSRASLMSHSGVADIMREVWGPTRRIEDLAIPLAIVAADLATGHEIVFNRGLLWAAALASISIPGVYPPQMMAGRVLADGGLVDPVPATVARDLGADVVVAVRLSTRGSPAGHQVVEATEPSGRAPSVVQTMLRARELLKSRIQPHPAGASMVVDVRFPANGGLGLRDFGKGERFVMIGREAAATAIPRLAEMLPWMATSAS